MGAQISKTKCMLLPAQSGKTRKVQELIKRYSVLSNMFGEGDFNVFISANNRLLVSQTTKRMTVDLCVDAAGDEDDDSTTEDADDTISGSVFSWTCGSKKKTSTLELAAQVVMGDVGMVILCANKRRVTYLYDLITALHRMRFAKNINIWIDEADASVGIWSKFEHVLAYPIVKQVTMVSATYSAGFFKKFPIPIMPFKVTHPDCYRCLKDSVVIVEDIASEDACDYTKKVLAKYPGFVHPGACAFIPGDKKRDSHYALRDLLLPMGFVVLILNGEMKQIVFPNGRIIALDGYLKVTFDDKGKEVVPEEFNDVLAKIYKEERLDRYPFAITGRDCVERGVTFQSLPSVEKKHDGFLFNCSIIPPTADASTATQVVARVFGNIGASPHYAPATIYSNSETIAKVRRCEEISLNLARLVHEEGLGGEAVTKALLDRAADPEKDAVWNVPTVNKFDTFEKAIKYIKDTKSGNNRKAPEAEADGFIHSSTTGKKRVLDCDTTLAEMKKWSKTANFDIKNDGPLKTAYSRLYIAYKDTTDNKSAVYIVRTITKKPLPRAAKVEELAGANPFDE
jgi:hypothetical protein